MSWATRDEVKWDVASAEILRQLIAAPPPAGLRLTETTQSLHRDIYYDTPDGSLARRDITCRLRIGADDRRILTVTLAAQRQRFKSRVTELDLAAAVRGESEAARRLRGLVDPASLETLAELEVERTTRVMAGWWPWSASHQFMYDAVTVRHGRLSRAFREVKLRRLREGKPHARRGGGVAAGRVRRPFDPGEPAHPGPAHGGDAGGRGAGPVAGHRAGGDAAGPGWRGGGVPAVREGLTLPIADGQGEAASRHLLRATFGSGVGDVALLGTASGRGAAGRLQEVWVVRRLRLDNELADGIEWIAAGGGRRDGPGHRGWRIPIPSAALVRRDALGPVPRQRRERARASRPSAAGAGVAGRRAAAPRRRSQHAGVPEPGHGDGGRPGDAAARAAQLSRHREREPRRVLHGERRGAEGRR